MTPLAYRKQISSELESLLKYGHKEVSIYTLGSISASRQVSFHSTLSDVDLLVVPTLGSLESYVNHFEQLINVTDQLNRRIDQLVEVFLMSSNTVNIYLNYLSVMAGDNVLRDEDHIFGKKEYQNRDTKSSLPMDIYRKNLYFVKAVNFCSEYGRLLPLADTGNARKVAKLLLRGIKFIICANTGINVLTQMEQKLFSVNTFNEAKAILNDIAGIELTVDNIIQRAFDGESIDDWPNWMIAQDVFARQLMELKIDTGFSVNTYRLYDGMCQVREMLIVRLKDVLNEKGKEKRSGLIDKYANNTASAVAKLALAGVTSLANFEKPTTPRIVLQSYTILVDHLKTGMQSLQCLAASVILLEYAFEQSTIDVNFESN